MVQSRTVSAKPGVNPGGMTLLELLVVVAVIGVLAAIGFSRWMQYRRRGVDAQMYATVDAARTALEGFHQASGNTYVGARESDLTRYGFRLTSGVVMNLNRLRADSYRVRVCATGGSQASMLYDSITGAFTGGNTACRAMR
jgi:prepilin-type N-terminal cleavage/methylation domain-containing protein